MTMLAKMLTAAALAGVAAAPAAAQYQYPQPYPQPYPSYPQQGYPQQGYPQGGNVFEQMIGGLLGGNYNVDERQAVTQCAQAAVSQAQNQYRSGYGGYNGYQQPYQYGQQGFAPPGMRVTAITQVERRSSGLRVRGLIDSGYYGGQWGYQQQQQQQQGYQNQQYAVGDLKFRCTVDYRGYVSNVRVERNDDYRRY